jgi:two-component system cell cycle sensor histidine kinase/response regulator CckA
MDESSGHFLDGGVVLELLLEGVQVLDRELRYLYLNRAAAEHGRRPLEEYLGRSMVELYPGTEETEMYATLQRCLRDGRARQMENAFTFPDGSVHWFELRINPVPEGVMILSLDINQRKRLEQQVQRAERMEMAGQLAGAVAHDFNNLLTIITASAEQLTADLPPSHSARRDLEEVLQATRAAGGLTRKLLSLGRERAAAPVRLDLDEAVASLEPLLARTLGSGVSLSLELGDPGTIRIGEGQLDRVLINLASNARDAMPDGGRLTVRTERTVLDADYAEHHFEVTPGEYALISVSDTGEGIPPALRDRIFEPFFTTRPPGEGSGLGLSSIYGIVKRAHGHIWVYSEPGQGTTFKLYLPLADARPQVGDCELPLEALRGQEAVLVVDDQPALRALCRQALSSLGYQVFTAAAPAAALAFSARHRGALDGLVVDMSMPGMSGLELAERLLSRRPGLAVVLMSGFGQDPPLLGGREVRFLEKPFTPSRLACALRQSLDARPPHAS